MYRWRVDGEAAAGLDADNDERDAIDLVEICHALLCRVERIRDSAPDQSAIGRIDTKDVKRGDHVVIVVSNNLCKGRRIHKRPEFVSSIGNTGRKSSGRLVGCTTLREPERFVPSGFGVRSEDALR